MRRLADQRPTTAAEAASQARVKALVTPLDALAKKVEDMQKSLNGEAPRDYSAALPAPHELLRELAPSSRWPRRRHRSSARRRRRRLALRAASSRRPSTGSTSTAGSRSSEASQAKELKFHAIH